MELKLFDSERKVMEVLWDAAQDLPAREVARRLEQSVGWNKNTTYTVIKKCVEKEAIERREPNFQCHGQPAVCLPGPRKGPVPGGDRPAEETGGRFEVR